MLFFKGGKLFQEFAVDRSKKFIKSLFEVRPDYANLQTNGEIKKVSPSSILSLQMVLIKPSYLL